MSNSFFRFKTFTIHQDHCAMKVCTDACLFGAWVADHCTRQLHPPESVLDIGAGTGLLSLMMAQKLTNARIDTVELEEACAFQAAENVDASPWSGRIQILQGDIRSIHLGKKYDYILSNPPFYANDLKSPSITRNLALHSEALQLPDLFTKAVSLLAPHGKLALLLPAVRESETLSIATTHQLWPENIISVQPSTTHAPFRVIFVFGREKREPNKTTICIREATNYSKAFQLLLSDYYEDRAWRG